MIHKNLTEHQQRQLRYFEDVEKGTATLALGFVNMSVLTALFRKGLVTVALTNEGRGTLRSLERAHKRELCRTCLLCVQHCKCLRVASEGTYTGICPHHGED